MKVKDNFDYPRVGFIFILSFLYILFTKFIKLFVMN